MYRRIFSAAALALAGSVAPAAQAAGDVDLLRNEFDQKLKAMQADYDARLREIEQRQAAPSAANSFNPEISLILQGGYVDAREGERRPSGYLQSTDVTAPKRGFSIQGAELVLAANIDPYLRGSAIIVVDADGSTSVEEAWGQTLGLGSGLTFKGGRFLSGIGYQNEQHPHAWDFSDNNLMYQTLFGEHLVQDGVQVKWLAPTNAYLELGAELGSGAAFPGSSVDRNGASSWAAFGHVGGDVGESNSWRAGLSYLAMRPASRKSTVVDATAAEADVRFSGAVEVWMLDFVWKWAPAGNAAQTNFKLQAELFQRTESGDLTYAPDAANSTAAYSARQTGGYVQAVYQFMPRWRTGLRYDQLDHGNVNYGANIAYLSNNAYTPSKTSVMVDYAPSEFSLFRVQLSQDRSMHGNPDDRVISLQYVYSLGPHGAHKF